MKKLTGTILLTAILSIHVAITIATEESYIFSSSDAMPVDIDLAITGTSFDPAVTGSASPVAAGSFIKSSGLYAVEEQLNP